jgi:hypothetical protein
MKPQSDEKYGDRLREVMNRVSTKDSDISKIWKEQELSEARRQALEDEYRKTKLKLKQTKKELRSEYLDPDLIKGKIGSVTSVIQTKAKTFQARAKPLQTKTKPAGKRLINYSKAAPVWAKVCIVLVLVVGAGLIIKSSSQTTGILGVSSGENSSATDGNTALTELPREKPTFDILYRQGIDPDLYDVARVNPAGSAEAYTYLDRVSEEGTVFRVTQQKVPDNFSLATVAEDFQATNVIQVDENIIYHGYSEKGRTQSILFVKDSLLVLVRSPDKLADDAWASYFLSLE